MLQPRRLVSVGMLGVLAIWFVLLRPAFLGGPASYVIVSGKSMEPNLYTGDLAFVLKRDSYAAGDIVAFHVDADEAPSGSGGGIVIHRIIGGNAEDGFILQGDNNDHADPWQPTPDRIRGRALLYVPRLGALFSYLQHPVRLAVAIGVPLGYTSLAGFLISNQASGSRERRRLRRMRTAQRRAGLASWLSR